MDPPKNGRMGQPDSALGHHLDQVAGAEFKGQVPPHAQHDDLLVKMPPLEEILCRGRFRHPGSYRSIPSFSSVCTRTPTLTQPPQPPPTPQQPAQPTQQPQTVTAQTVPTTTPMPVDGQTQNGQDVNTPDAPPAEKNRNTAKAEAKLEKAMEYLATLNTTATAKPDKWVVNASILASMTGCYRPAINTFIEARKQKIDELNAAHGLGPGHNRATARTHPNAIPELVQRFKEEALGQPF